MRTNRFWKSGRWGALLLAVLAVALVGIAIVFAATQVFVVTPTALQDWQIRNTAGAQPTPASTPSVTFVNGPDTPPLSNGSVQLSVGSDGSAAAQLRQPDYAGTVLPNPNPSPDAFPAGNELTALSYSTYVQVGGSASQAPYIILDVDYDNNGTIDDHLVFEPQYQIAGFCPSNPQGPVTSGVWQSWDAFNGCWYSTSGAAGSGPGANVKVLTAFSSAQPSATIVNVGNGDGGVRLVAGLGGVIGGGSASDWAGFVGNADAFLIGVGFDTDTGPEARDYDFEPSTPTPSNVDLGVLKTANPTQTMPDHDVTYTIKVQNLGGADAMNATLNDTLPSDMTFVSLSSAAGWMCSTPSVGMGGLVTCSNPSVSGGANDTFTLVGHIPSSAADGSSYINTATVTTDSTDSFDENNSSTAETDVFTFINQAPTFTKGPDQTVNEDAGPQTVSHWATGMSPGPANESGQSLNFIVTNNSNPGLFSAGPSIDATTGTLT
ncbi:MAG TPA: DUF11 domain-containing protein, partial [Pyrinomonadaceae bacterium]|nr:DUF11 domain-containing protein [Pyrinomonadaceae bacterium]